MNVQTKRWARPLALFIALTMVMMYSFGGVALAGNADDKVFVHYKGLNTDEIVVKVTVGSIQYSTDTLTTTNGKLYKGNFYEEPEFPPEFKGKLDATNAIVLLNGVPVEIDEKSSADGGGVINIRIKGYVEEQDPAYDLLISKTVNGSESASVSIDEIASFVIQVTNYGPDEAKSVQVEDVLPVGLDIGGIIAEKGTYSTISGIWSIGDLGKDDSVSLTINVSSSIDAEYRNTAEIKFSPNYDTNNQNNEDTATLKVCDPSTPNQDLQILKVVDEKTVMIGDTVAFTIEAKNIGKTAIDEVLVTDSLPEGLSLSAVEYTPGTTFSGITWHAGTLGAGEAKYLTISAVTTTLGAITNTASGTAIGDTTLDNNSDSETVLVNPKTQPPEQVKDLEITKTVNQPSVTVGTGVIFTITVKNIGNTTMGAVEVEETWPDGLTRGTANAAEGTTFSGTTWEIGTLGPDESKTLTIAAGTPTAGPYTNNVAIDFGEGADDNLLNNTAAAIVTVTNPTNNEEDNDNDTPSGGGGGTGGGGGGGTTTTITPTPPPLAEIPEAETPLVEAPEVVLEEQPIPLADVPQTGDNTNIWLLLALMMGSGAGIVLLGRRKETVEK